MMAKPLAIVGLVPRLFLFQLLLATPLVTSQSSSPSLPAAAAVAGRVEDYFAIKETITHYAVTVDLKDWPSLSRVFTADVVADYGPGIGVVTGLETLQRSLENGCVYYYSHKIFSCPLYYLSVQ